MVGEYNSSTGYFLTLFSVRSIYTDSSVGSLWLHGSVLLYLLSNLMLSLILFLICFISLVEYVLKCTTSRSLGLQAFSKFPNTTQ